MTQVQEPAKGPSPVVLSADDETLRQLGEDIDLARLAPGQTISVDALARRLRAPRERTLKAVAHFAQLSWLNMDGESCVIAPIQRDHLVERLDRRLAIEQQLAAAAARNASNINTSEIEVASSLLKRCALVGDIDGYMQADRRLEKAIAAAASLPALSEEVDALKREFRRAWCAFNRLRDLNVPAAYRQALVQAVINGDTEAARDAVKKFIDYLRQSY